MLPVSQQGASRTLWREPDAFRDQHEKGSVMALSDRERRVLEEFEAEFRGRDVRPRCGRSFVQRMARARCRARGALRGHWRAAVCVLFGVALCTVLLVFTAAPAVAISACLLAAVTGYVSAALGRPAQRKPPRR